ncbi:hypothetical protein HDU98_006027 [Podochytrium sp. JEL0797]|nr:hypothetical protein HDU98_006027 [Podochytrium sp. JEL0797]
MDNPSAISCVCIPPNMVHTYLDPESSKPKSFQFPKVSKNLKQQTSKDSVWNGKHGNKQLEPRLTAKDAATYAKKIELLLQVAILEQHRVIVLGAFGCGAHATPPRHAAEIYRDVLSRVDPRGNVTAFADVLTFGDVTSLSDLQNTPAINETEYEFMLRTRLSEASRKPSNNVSVLLKPIIKAPKPLADKISSSRDTLIGSSKESLSGNQRRLPFEIHSSSSHEDGFAPQQLVDQGTNPQAKGWQSERFCIYPQHIVVRFSVGECRIQKIQVLSHHFKIATRLEFYVGTKERRRRVGSAVSNVSVFSASTMRRGSAAGGHVQDGIRFSRLGFVSLGDNLSSDFKARELKSVPVSEDGEFLKIVFHQNYINGLNLYNQVGLVSLTILGEYDDSQAMGIQALSFQSKSLLRLDPLFSEHAPAAAESSDFNASLYQDQTIVKIIQAATQAKKDAVKNENYRLANTMKVLLELCNKAAEEIMRLLLLKAKSIEREDYELAEDAKADIDQIKDALDTKISQLGLKRTPDNRIVPVGDVKPTSSSNQTHPPIHTPDTTVDLPKDTLLETMRLDAIAKAEEDLRQQKLKDEETARRVELSLLPKPEDVAPVALEPAKPANISKVDSLPSIPGASSTAPEPTKRRKLPAMERSNSIPILPNVSGYSLPPVDTPADTSALGAPEELSDELKDKYAVLIQVYGPFLAACILSGRQFKLREQALEDVVVRVEAWRTNHAARKKGKKKEEGKVEAPPVVPVKEKVRIDWSKEVDAPEVDKETFVEATFMVVERGLDDSREKAISLALALWELLTKTCVSRDISKLIVFRHLDTLFPSLLLKAGHMNPRVKQGCLDLVVLLAKSYHTIPHSVIKFLLKPPKPTASPRYTISRLDALHLVLMKLGVDDMKQLDNSGSGLTIKSAMLFAEPHLHNKTTEIRESAVKVVVDLCLLVDTNDELIFSYLNNVKSQTMHILETKLELARHGKEMKAIAGLGNSSESLVDSTMNVSSESMQLSPPLEPPPSVPEPKSTSTRKKKPQESPEKKLVQDLKDELKSLKEVLQATAAQEILAEPLNASTTESPSTVEVTDSGAESVKVAAKLPANVKPKTAAGTSKPKTPAARPSTKSGKENSLASKVGSPKPKPKPKAGDSRMEEKESMSFRAKSRQEAEDRSSVRTPTPRTPRTPVSKKVRPEIVALKPTPMKPLEKTDKLTMTLVEERLANAYNRTCIFCNEKNAAFTDENLDIHYWRDCPMLCACPLCHLIVEIPTLTTHMVDECDNKKLVKLCSRCKETVLTSEFQLHLLLLYRESRGVLFVTLTCRMGSRGGKRIC